MPSTLAAVFLPLPVDQHPVVGQDDEVAGPVVLLGDVDAGHAAAGAVGLVPGARRR